MIEKNKYERIIDVINESYKNKDVKPNFYAKRIFTDDIFIQLDTPRKEGAYHWSTFDFRCRRDLCRISGEIVTKREFEKYVSDGITETGCSIRKIHQYPESIVAAIPGRQHKKEQLESHIHFTCLNKDYKSTIKIATFLREY